MLPWFLVKKSSWRRWLVFEMNLSVGRILIGGNWEVEGNILGGEKWMSDERHGGTERAQCVPEPLWAFPTDCTLWGTLSTCKGSTWVEVMLSWMRKGFFKKWFVKCGSSSINVRLMNSELVMYNFFLNILTQNRS